MPNVKCRCVAGYLVLGHIAMHSLRCSISVATDIAWSVCVLDAAVSSAKMAGPIVVLFEVGTWEPKEACYRCRPLNMNYNPMSYSLLLP